MSKILKTLNEVSQRKANKFSQVLVKDQSMSSTDTKPFTVEGSDPSAPRQNYILVGLVLAIGLLTIINIYSLWVVKESKNQNANLLQKLNQQELKISQLDSRFMEYQKADKAEFKKISSKVDKLSGDLRQGKIDINSLNTRLSKMADTTADLKAKNHSLVNELKSIKQTIAQQQDLNSRVSAP